MAIGTSFGNSGTIPTVGETSNRTEPQSAPTTGRLTLQALAPATHPGVLTPHHAMPVRVPAAPRFECASKLMLGNYIKFDMEGIEDGLAFSSDYKKFLFELFFGFKHVSPFEAVVRVSIGDFVPLFDHIKIEAVNFANKFMTEAVVVYGIDAHVFCRAACGMTPRHTFGNFVSRCMDMQFGPTTQAPLEPCRDKVQANAEFILLKAEAEIRSPLRLRSDSQLYVGLADLFNQAKNLAHEIKANASACLMMEVALHHLGQLRRSDDLNDLELAARLLNCLHLCARNVPKEHYLVDDIALKLYELAARAAEESDEPELERCAKVANALRRFSPDVEGPLCWLDEVVLGKAGEEAVIHLGYVLDWFRDEAKLRTAGGVGDHAAFGFQPANKDDKAAFVFTLHAAKALELAAAWAHDPLGDMTRVMAILDYVRENSQGAPPKLIAELREAYDALKAGLEASPLPEVRERAKQL